MSYHPVSNARNDDDSQASSSISPVNNDIDLIGALARSDRGDHRVVAAVATIALETSPSVDPAAASRDYEGAP